MRSKTATIRHHYGSRSMVLPVAGVCLGIVAVLWALHSRQQKAPNPISKVVADAFAARLNGKFITRGELNDFITCERVRILARNQHDQESAKTDVEHLKIHALGIMIERELLTSEFRKLNGSIKQSYVDEAVDRIIREDFQGDRNQLVARLAEGGVTLKTFRRLEESRLIAQVMKMKVANELAPPSSEEIEEYYAQHREEFRSATTNDRDGELFPLDDVRIKIAGTLSAAKGSTKVSDWITSLTTEAKIQRF